MAVFKERWVLNLYSNQNADKASAETFTAMALT
jgi:hypothetical protein